MLKQFFDFILTGVSVVFVYIVYFISAFLVTFIFGVPIALAIKFISNMADIMYNNLIM